MENKWKLTKAVAFILSLTAFIYVGQMLSQNGRYQSVTLNSGVGVAIIDTQTGTVQYFAGEDEGFKKIDFKGHTFE
ncbi:hypothetical protein [Flavobacterium sp. XS2P14]|uniref:hypothetical protein n=1 Tax=Flavobacterium sp. XS2P14 TaxID=3401735 RepID=UPI003AAC0EAF